MVAKNLSPLQGGNTSHSHHGDSSTSASEVYMFKEVNVMNQANNFDTPPSYQTKGKVVDQPSTPNPPPSSNPLHIENTISDIVLCHPKSAIRKVKFNTNPHAAQI
jgi:hypothetical protein